MCEVEKKNDNNSSDGKSFELSFGVEKSKIGSEMRHWWHFLHNHPNVPRSDDGAMASVTRRWKAISSTSRR